MLKINRILPVWIFFRCLRRRYLITIEGLTNALTQQGKLNITKITRIKLLTQLIDLPESLKSKVLEKKIGIAK